MLSVQGRVCAVLLLLFLSINIRMSNADDASCAAAAAEWTVLYHQPGKFKGRGEFLRLMLEDAGVAYQNSAEGLYGADGMMDVFRGSPQAVLKDDDDKSLYPMLFPPAIWHRPTDGREAVLINQAGACMIYLGSQLGYAPSSDAERARADSILLNAQDYIAEGRISFHPVKNTMSYRDQKEEGDKVSKEFCDTRMRYFLYHFEKIVARAGIRKPVAGGPNLTYADFALFHVIDATIAQFNTEFYGKAWDNCKETPNLKTYYEWMKSRPKLQAYFASDRCAPFAGDSMM